MNLKSRILQVIILKKYYVEVCIPINTHRSDYWNIFKIFKKYYFSGLNFELNYKSSDDCKFLKLESRKIF